MALTTSAAFPQSVIASPVNITNATGTTPVTVVTPGSNFAKIDALFITSNDTVIRDIVLTLLISGVAYTMGTLQVPIGAGVTDTVPTVDVLRHAQFPMFAYDAYGNKCFYLPNGTQLQAYAPVAVGSGKTITVTAMGANF